MKKNMAFNEVLRSVANEINLVEDTIKDNFQSTASLIPIISTYLMENGGKRIRPLLVILSSKLCGYNNGNRHIQYSCIVEFVHVATLLHDDVIDDAKIRRGKKTANLKWGNKASVLVADYLFAKSFLMMSEDKNSKIMKFMSNATKEIVEGETLQLMNICNIDVTEVEYLDIVNKKTAVLIAAACKIGPALVDAPEKHESALESFGRKIGTAFQLIDDYLDYFSEESKLGKKIGNDLLEGNVTMPLIHLYARATPEEREFIEEVIKSPKDIDVSVKKICKLMKDYGSNDYTINMANRLIEEAKTELKCFPPSDHVDAILSIADYIVNRDM